MRLGYDWSVRGTRIRGCLPPDDDVIRTSSSSFVEIPAEHPAVIIFSGPVDSLAGEFSFQIVVSTGWKKQSRCAKRLVLQKATVRPGRRAAKSDLIGLRVHFGYSAGEQSSVVGRINGQEDCPFAL